MNGFTNDAVEPTPGKVSELDLSTCGVLKWQCDT